MAKLALDIKADTQFATLFAEGQPVGTFVRRRVYAADPAAWRVYDKEGREVFAFTRSCAASSMAHTAARALGVA